MKLTKLLPALFVSVGAVSAAGASLVDLLPAGSKIVLGVRVRSLADSQFVKGLLGQAQLSNTDWLKKAAALGFDPLHDVDEVMLATTGEGQNPPSLMVASGRFNVARLAEGAQRYHEVPILGGDKAGDSIVAILDANTALAGDRPMVMAAIDRHGAAPDGALAARVSALRDRYDVWGFGDRPEGFVSSPQAGAVEGIDRFQFGLSLQKGLELAAEVHARTVKDAEKLNATLALLTGMLKVQQPAGGVSFDLQTKNGTFKLAMTIPEEELKKAMAAQSGALAQMLAATTGPTTGGGFPLKMPSAPKPTPPPVLDKDGNTVVLTLPGGKG
jgi:hypothetical protein